MLFKSLSFLLTLTLGFVFGAIMPGPTALCGVQPSDEHKAMLNQHFMDSRSYANTSAQSFAPAKDTVRVFVHIITKSGGQNNGNISDETIHRQIAVMNEEFAAAAIAFNLESIDRTINDEWAMDQKGSDMRTQLRKGSYRDLNLYFIFFMGQLGYCKLPAIGPLLLDDFQNDGCNIRHDIVPGGPDPTYNRGIVTVHEIGHWLGLFHTFSGGCDEPGDFIDDTPAERGPTFGCPKEERDSCPDKPGKDPLHNIMSYTDETCNKKFTPLQNQRMRHFWETRINLSPFHPYQEKPAKMMKRGEPLAWANISFSG